MPARLRTSFGPIAAALFCQFAAVTATLADNVDPLNIPDTQLEPVSWTDLDGWAADDHAAAFATFRASCQPLLRQRQGADGRPIHGALREVCKRAAAAGKPGSDKDKARAFFEDNFRPVRIARLGETTVLLTGYYEPIVDGSRFPNPEFHTPLYRRPRDLVVAGHKPGTGPVPNRGSVSRLNAKKELEPYYDRAAIEDGALDGQKLEICWVKDPFDAMTIQIQGSARVKLEDGTTVRINYDAHNGHSYTAVGRILIERNLVPRDEMSMERIKRWMQANPDQAKEVRATNRSYVFFRITSLSDEGEPAGAQGVALTPGRSIAVDRTHVYGTPFFIEADLPVASERPSTNFRRLMVAQDTGSAILGAARADLYWGAGDDAGRIAGRIRHQGRFVILIPRELDMVEAGKTTPLPRAKPAVPAPNATKKVAGKAKAKAEADKIDGAKKPLPKSRLQAEPAARTKSKPRS